MLVHYTGQVTSTTGSITVNGDMHIVGSGSPKLRGTINILGSLYLYLRLDDQKIRRSLSKHWNRSTKAKRNR